MLFKENRHKLEAAVFCALIFATSMSHAQQGQDNRRHGPPPEAIEACANLSEGDACSFSGRRGEDVPGSCKTSPRDESLICAPEGGRPGRPGPRD